MRPLSAFWLAVCLFSLSLPACSAPATPDGYSTAELKRLAAGDFSAFQNLTAAQAQRIARKDPEAPLFLALHLLQAGDETAAGMLLEAAAGFTRDTDGSLQTDARLQKKIPQLNRIAAAFALCPLFERKSRSAAYLNSPEPFRRDLLALTRLLESGESPLYAPASAEVFSLESFPGYAENIRLLENARIRTEAAQIPSEPQDTEEAVAKLLALVQDRAYGEAAALFFSLTEQETEAQTAAVQSRLLSSRAVLSACGHALLYSDTAPEQAVAALEKLNGRLAQVSGTETDGGGREAEYMLTFYLSRLSAKLPDGRETAARLMERSVSIAPTASDRDTSLWYLFDTARAAGNDALLALLEEKLRAWHNPRFFSDILSSLTTALTAAKDREALARLEALLPPDTPPADRERLAYINALFLPEGNPRREEKLKALAESAQLPYYRLKSAEALGLPAKPEFPYTVAGGAGYNAALCESPEYRAAQRAFSRQAEALLNACADWHIPAQTAVFVRAFPYADFRAVEKTAAKLAHDRQYAHATRLLLYAMPYVNPEEFRGRNTLRTARLLYPKPWKAEIESAVGEFAPNAARANATNTANAAGTNASANANAPTNADKATATVTAKGSADNANARDAGAGNSAFSEELIFALIRQESLFQPDAVSSAGAGGLTQLMPATAEEIAGRLKTPDYDVFSPQDNIRFGTYYISEMLRRLDGELVPALCAYNAGITRVRRWQADFGYSDFHEGLFLETVPFNETRIYARNILTFRIFYANFYAD